MLKHQVIPLNNRQLQHTKVYASRCDTFDLLPTNGICMEVGVAFGDFSDFICQKLSPRKFHAVDKFSATYEKQFFGEQRFGPDDNHESFYAKRFKKLIEQGVVQMHKGLSWEIISDFPDNYFDFVYIDAGHAYEFVKKDIQAVYPKMKPGSYIQFNDYTLYDYIGKMEYGIVQAVNEFLHEYNYGITAICIVPNGFHDVLVKLDPLPTT